MVDTNILVDYIVPDRPEHVYDEQLLAHLVDGKDTGYVTSGSLKDCYYICRKYIGEPACRALIRAFLIIFDVPPTGMAECRESAYSTEPDFEDGLIRAVAEHNNADVIITRDSAAFQSSNVNSMSAREYLQNLNR
ncbi:PIN domain-containing protein [Bifidobacterium sp. ESL0764]|nr:PIN domain-containing protein [Bifidobacterium sp. ESL0764]WEV66576.1 PIN domain-containing protein [Bifidobacterium sp. ESL0764]